MLLLLSNNINKQSVHRNICVGTCCWCRRLLANKIQTANTGGSIQRLKNEYNNTSQFFTNSRKISCSEKLSYFIFYIYLKRMGLNLSTNLPMFVYTFQAIWRHRPLKECWVFVGIRAVSTFFSPNHLNTLWSALLANSLSIPALLHTSSFLTLSIRDTPFAI